MGSKHCYRGTDHLSLPCETSKLLVKLGKIPSGVKGFIDNHAYIVLSMFAFEWSNAEKVCLLETCQNFWQENFLGKEKNFLHCTVVNKDMIIEILGL